MGRGVAYLLLIALRPPAHSDETVPTARRRFAGPTANSGRDLESILGSIYGDFDLSDIGDSKLESIKGELASKDPIESDIEINQAYKDILGEDPSVPKCLDLSIHQVILPRLKFWLKKKRPPLESVR
ncbi:uncharacterized protein LOC117179448 [Belonocnema kinseyi]|uniref:uncharacterized protein LOC117179448 n=1 Tax=Belonocnema kinseyi TaxID=2817044 RepID=UPI00143D34F1|nr:uncharacterized protein LOC117179448 [Belonocnema kinseyi]